MTKFATPGPRFYTISVIAELLHVSPKTVRRWIERGDLHAHRLGHQYRITDEDLSAFLARRRK